MSVSQEALVDWVALSFVTGVGSRTAARLVEAFGSPAACLEARPADLESRGLNRDAILELTGDELRERARRQLAELAAFGARAIALEDPLYPQWLRETFDPPIVIYVRGDLERAIQQPAIAIVGSRRCSTYGRNVAEMLSRQLAERGITIVSGLARGIDAAAHRGALDGRGLTVAVLGTGVDEVYPKEHERLAARIMEQGALLSEFPLATPPVPRNFPFRNRVISGLSLGVLVVEAAERSGSLITARLAMEQGREVFAVPGNITSAKSFGPNYLIQDGARLVQTWRDVVEELPRDLRAAILAAEPCEAPAPFAFEGAALNDAERRVLALLNADEALHLDLLIERSGLAPGELMSALLRLEMGERIRQLPGKRFARRL